MVPSVTGYNLNFSNREIGSLTRSTGQRGSPNGGSGWPVGLRWPPFTEGTTLPVTTRTLIQTCHTTNTVRLTQKLWGAWMCATPKTKSAWCTRGLSQADRPAAFAARRNTLSDQPRTRRPFPVREWNVVPRRTKHSLFLELRESMHARTSQPTQ